MEQQKDPTITLKDGRTVLIKELNQQAQQLVVIVNQLNNDLQKATYEEIKTRGANEHYTKLLEAAVVSHLDAKAAAEAAANEAVVEEAPAAE